MLIYYIYYLNKLRNFISFYNIFNTYLLFYAFSTSKQLWIGMVLLYTDWIQYIRSVYTKYLTDYVRWACCPTTPLLVLDNSAIRFIFNSTISYWYDRMNRVQSVYHKFLTGFFLEKAWRAVVYDLHYCWRFIFFFILVILMWI